MIDYDESDEYLLREDVEAFEASEIVGIKKKFSGGLQALFDTMIVALKLHDAVPWCDHQIS